MSKASMLFSRIAERDATVLRVGLWTNTGKQARAESQRYRRLLVEQIHTDLELPAHVRSQFDHPLWMGCTECDRGEVILSVACAADFADQHAHCLAWFCDRCGNHEYGFKSRCRFCGDENVGRHAEHKVIVHQVVARYAIRLQKVPVAWVVAPSLLRARRAARAMWPQAGLELTVHMAGVGSGWTATYGRDL